MARPKGYSKKNYYTKSALEDAASETKVKIDKGTGQRIINNVYVHSGLYNFSRVVKQYRQSEAGSVITKLGSQLRADFKKEINEAKKLEQQIYRATYPGISTPKALEQYLKKDQVAEEVLNSLNIYDVMETVLSSLPESKDGYVNKKTVQNGISKEISSRLEKITESIDTKYVQAFDFYSGGLDAKKYFLALKDKKVALNQLKNSPSKFMQISAFQGNLGEFSVLLDQIAKSKGQTTLVSELRKGFNSSKNISIKGVGELNAKSDIGVESLDFEFGIQSKNYKDFSKQIGVHDSKTKLNAMFDLGIIQQASEEMNLNTILKDANLKGKEFEKFLQYCIVNAQTFRSSGVYLKPQDKKSNSTSAYTTYNAFNKEVSFINEYVGYLSSYWLGTKILEGQAKNKRNAFFYFGNKIVPVSEILETILQEIDKNNFLVTPKFSGVKVFTPSVLKEQKWKVIQDINKTKKWDGERSYPAELLKIGSAIGQASLENITFSVEMKLKNIKI